MHLCYVILKSFCVICVSSTILIAIFTVTKLFFNLVSRENLEMIVQFCKGRRCVPRFLEYRNWRETQSPRSRQNWGPEEVYDCIIIRIFEFLNWQFLLKSSKQSMIIICPSWRFKIFVNHVNILHNFQEHIHHWHLLYSTG